MSFLWAFHADFNYVILKMIPWPKLEGTHSKDTMGKALPPISAVTKEDSNPLLLPAHGALRVAALQSRLWDHFKNYIVEISMKCPKNDI